MILEVSFSRILLCLMGMGFALALEDCGKLIASGFAKFWKGNFIDLVLWEKDMCLWCEGVNFGAYCDED